MPAGTRSNTFCGQISRSVLSVHVTAQIFWMKTRAGWREERAPEDPVPGAEAGSNLHVVILPDNGRDPGLTKELLKAQEKYYSRKRRRFDE